MFREQAGALPLRAAAAAVLAFSPADKRLLVTRGKDRKTAQLWEVSLK